MAAIAVEGIVLNARTSEQRMPHTIGRSLATWSLVIIVGILGFGALLFLLVASIVGCAVTPIFAAVIGGVVLIWRRMVLTNDVKLETRFDVIDPVNKLYPVVLYTDRGGTSGVVDGDYVRLTGEVLPTTNTLVVGHLEVAKRSGRMLAPAPRITGKQPMSSAAGVVWLSIALLPIALFLLMVVLSSLGAQR